jgi:tRNA uridine 5-carboxymethylaminomethyl modification enzyme
VKFPHRESHQVFLEPEGAYSEELYVAGLSTSLPEEVQYSFFRTVPGLEKVKILRPGYAMDYDCIRPYQLIFNFRGPRLAWLIQCWTNKRNFWL